MLGRRSFQYDRSVVVALRRTRCRISRLRLSFRLTAGAGSDGMWSGLVEKVKADLVGNFFGGTAERYYHKQLETWWQKQPKLQHVIERTHQTFRNTTIQAQAIKFLEARKDWKRSCLEHYLYLVAESGATGGA